MHYKTCEVCGVKSGRKKGEKRLFLAKFPLDEARCKQWVKVVGKEDLAYVPIEKLHSLKHICVKHFKPTDFKKKKTQLKKTAIPSIGLTNPPLEDDLLIGFPLHVAKKETSFGSSSKVFLEHNYSKVSKSSISGRKRPHSPEPSTSKAIYEKIEKRESVSEPFTSNMHTIHAMKEKENYDEFAPMLPSTSTPEIESIMDQRTELNISNPELSLLTPRKRKLLKQLKLYKIKNSNLRKKIKDIENVESPVLSLVESTIKNEKRRAHGKRWTNLNKSVALAIQGGGKSNPSFQTTDRFQLHQSVHQKSIKSDE